MSLRFGLIANAAILAAACGAEPPATKAWEVVVADQPGALLRAWGISAKDVYVVGADATGQGPFVYHYDGSSWRKLAPPVTGDIWWVHAIGPDDVRMVGDSGHALKYTPSTDTFEVRSTPTSMTLFGAWGATSGDVWYVGGDAGKQKGVILRDHDGQVEEIHHPSTANATIFKAFGFDDHHLWLTGQEGTMLFWDGQSLVEQSVGTNLPLMGIHGVSPTAIYASGGGSDAMILRFDGSSWTPESVPVTASKLFSVWTTDGEHAYAVGFNGTVLERNAGTWSQTADKIPTAQDLHSVWIDDQGEIWAAGGRLGADPPLQGTLIHFGLPLPRVGLP